MKQIVRFVTHNWGAFGTENLLVAHCGAKVSLHNIELNTVMQVHDQVHIRFRLFLKYHLYFQIYVLQEL